MKKALLVLILIVLAGAGIYLANSQKSKASITLLSPNGGESVQEGKTVPITWSTENIPESYKVSIGIRRVPPPPLPSEGQEFDPIVMVNLPNTGSTTWPVSDMYPEGNYILSLTAYESLPVTNPVTDESDQPFRIVKSPTANWQTYTNKKYGYSIKYPADWTFREFPSTKSGAGFRQQNSANDVASECVNIDGRSTAQNEYATPFADYVKKAAITEIQGYEKLNSIIAVSTLSGQTGYETTWLYRNPAGREMTSLPITYFDYQSTGTNAIKIKTIQVSLNSADCQTVYDQMLQTFDLGN